MRPGVVGTFFAFPGKFANVFRGNCARVRKRGGKRIDVCHAHHISQLLFLLPSSFESLNGSRLRTFTVPLSGGKINFENCLRIYVQIRKSVS